MSPSTTRAPPCMRGRSTRRLAAPAPRVQARTRSADGALGPIRTLSPTWAASTTSTSTPTPMATPSSSGRPTWAPTIRSRRGRGPRPARVGPLLQLSPPGQDATRPAGRRRRRWRRRLRLAAARRHEPPCRGASALRRRRPRADHAALVDPLDLGHPAGRGQPGRRRPVRLAQHRPQRRRRRPIETRPCWPGVRSPADRRWPTPRRRRRPAGRDRGRRRGLVRMAALGGLQAVAEGPPALRARRARREQTVEFADWRRSPFRRRGCRWMPTATR